MHCTVFMLRKTSSSSCVAFFIRRFSYKVTLLSCTPSFYLFLCVWCGWMVRTVLAHYRLVSVKLDEKMEHGESGVVRFRLWQPTHSGQNQWALDNLRVAPELPLNSLQADMAVSVVPLLSPSLFLVFFLGFLIFLILTLIVFFHYITLLIFVLFHSSLQLFYVSVLRDMSPCSSLWFHAFLVLSVSLSCITSTVQPVWCITAHTVTSLSSQWLQLPVVPQPNAATASPWLSVTSSSYAQYCGSDTEVQVMDGTEPVREAVTHPLTLSPGDVIAFQVSFMGCLLLACHYLILDSLHTYAKQCLHRPLWQCMWSCAVDCLLESRVCMDQCGSGAVQVTWSLT